MQFAPQVTDIVADVAHLGDQTLTIDPLACKCVGHYCGGVGLWFAQQWKKLVNPAGVDNDDRCAALMAPLIGADGETSLIGGDIEGGELFEFGSSIDLPNHKDEDA
ncbi:hypothetical protein O9993_02310 [Vibrio lentus]|nr:hypothetical protein [Vibrio lentus]